MLGSFWRRSASTIVLVAVTVSLFAGAITVYVLGQPAAAVGLGGVVVGTLLSTLPQTMKSNRDRVRRNRVAALLWRDDIHAFQDWMYRSVRDQKWYPCPEEITGLEHMRDIADGLETWEGWEPVTTARRAIRRLITASQNEAPGALHSSIYETFDDINRARSVLAGIDGGRTNEHGATTRIRALLMPGQ